MSKYDGRWTEYAVDLRVAHATVELLLSDGSRISAQIGTADALLEVIREELNVYAFGDAYPLRHLESTPRLRLEIEGSMATCVIRTRDGSDSRPTAVAPERSQ